VDNGNPNRGLEKSLPSSYYYSAEMFEREKEFLFAREWFCAGREEELPSPGTVLVREVAGESVLIVRTKDGKLTAHYNVCRHRGARLCGNAEEDRWGVKLREAVTPAATIRCPYHQWTYNLDGSLISAPFLNEAEGFRKADFSLFPVGLETWGGFIYLNLSPEMAAAEGRTLPAQLNKIPERVKRYALAELRTARQLEYEVVANWKILLENFNECYHCGPVHPELCEIVPAFKHGGTELDWSQGIPHKEGATTFTWSGTTTRAPFPGLNEFEKVRHKGELIYPNVLISLSPDSVAAFVLWPRGPERTTVQCRFLFHPGEMAKPTFDPDDTIGFWDLVNRQDWAICERVHAGLKARVHQFGYYGPMEDDSADIRRYVAKLLAREKP
jgi:phenylpropionate dioxygenase-like ring-hydroxylating dioxygenase large terminal subunit